MGWEWGDLPGQTGSCFALALRLENDSREGAFFAHVVSTLSGILVLWGPSAEPSELTQPTSPFQVDKGDVPADSGG